MLSRNLTDVSTFFYYFAFGSNLLKERIHVQIKGAEFEAVGVLKNFALNFYDYGARWKGAVASIDEKEGSEVWGCVWRVPNTFATELDIQESGYHRLNVNVLVEGRNETVTCRTYQYSNPERQPHSPSPHYKLVIVKGAIEHHLPQHYIDKLKAIPDNGYRGEVSLDLEVFKELDFIQKKK